MRLLLTVPADLNHSTFLKVKTSTANSADIEIEKTTPWVGHGVPTIRPDTNPPKLWIDAKPISGGVFGGAARIQKALWTAEITGTNPRFTLESRAGIKTNFLLLNQSYELDIDGVKYSLNKKGEIFQHKDGEKIRIGYNTIGFGERDGKLICFQNGDPRNGETVCQEWEGKPNFWHHYRGDWK